MSPAAHRVVVVGGGFGGIQAALGLRRAPVEVTLVTGATSTSSSRSPTRWRRGRELRLASVDGIPAPAALPYDTLIVSGGSHYSYFGHDDWRQYAAEVKSLESAVAVRGRLLGAFEAAEQESDPSRREAWLTFAVVGAGPTGVEMAGQIAELARDTLRRDFRSIDPRSGSILLVEAAERPLTGFPPSLSAKAVRSLEQFGVTLLTGHTVVAIDADGVMVSDASGAIRRLPTGTVVAEISLFPAWLPWPCSRAVMRRRPCSCSHGGSSASPRTAAEHG